MKDSIVTVVARLTARGGMEEELRNELLSLVEPTRSEAGCINYDLHQVIEDRAVFVFHENWQSMAHLEKHRESPHLTAFRGKAGALLAAPMEVILLEKIS